MGKMRWSLAGGLLAALAVTASAGATHLGPVVLYRGHVNTITEPLLVDGLQAGGLVSISNHNTVASSGGIIGHGDGSGWGVSGDSSSGSGLIGFSVSGNGVAGISQAANASAVSANNSGSGWGVLAQTASLARPAIRGVHPGATGFGPGAEGESFSTADFASGVQGLVGFNGAGVGAAGVKGQNKSSGPNGYGVWGEHLGAGTGVLGTSVNEVGVWGEHTATTGSEPGIEGRTPSSADLAAGVFGQATGNGTLTAGVYGSSSSGIGLLGLGGSIGVLGYHPSGAAGYFIGDVTVSGTLTKGAGAFRIDHPLAPGRKYLQHSFVESPDMKNVYDGVVTTDRRGLATIQLPGYFQALNRDFRYQLTPFARRGLFPLANVVRGVAHNRFTIQTNGPHVKVSWQVTGIRKDAYANAHRIRPEIPKPAAERGTYLHPTLFGQPPSRTPLYLRARTAMK